MTTIYWRRGERPTLENVGEFRAIHIDKIKVDVFAVTKIIKGETLSHCRDQPGLVMCGCDDVIHDDYIFSDPIDVNEIVSTGRNIAKDKSIKVRRGKLYIIRLTEKKRFFEKGYILTCRGINDFLGMTESGNAICFFNIKRCDCSEIYEVKITDREDVSRD